MTTIASFNYTQSGPAAAIGLMVAIAVAGALIWHGRPLLAALLGAISWSLIGYLVGIAGSGDMSGLIGTMNAILGLPAGALIAGLGAWIRKATRPSPAASRYESQSP